MTNRGRPSGEKTRCNGTWTEAKFNSFIKGNLRSATIKWGPIQVCKKQAHVRRGVYFCAGCQSEVPASIIVDRERKNNIFVDHINPIVDPAVGFTTWDDLINRMFCELDNLQVLCRKCHDEKGLEERAIAKERRAKEKELRNIQDGGEPQAEDLEPLSDDAEYTE